MKKLLNILLSILFVAIFSTSNCQTVKKILFDDALVSAGDTSLVVISPNAYPFVLRSKELTFEDIYEP